MLALRCQAELSVTRAAITQHEKLQAEQRESERLLHLQVERLQNALAHESGALAALQHSSELQLNSVTADLASQLQQLQGQLLSAHAHRQQIESQLETESQGLQRTQNALEEALRESASASAIEQHVKSKLATKFRPCSKPFPCRNCSLMSNIMPLRASALSWSSSCFK